MDCFSLKQPIDCCDIAMRSRFLTGRFDPNSVTKVLEPEHELLNRCIGEISTTGTCFIFSKPRYDIVINGGKVLAFGLTNFHVMYDMHTNKKKEHLFITFKHQPGKELSYSCEALLEFHSIMSEVQTSVTTGMPYCYPNDIAIVVIYKHLGYRQERFDIENCVELDELLIASEEECMSTSSIFVCGYPKNADLKYVLPGAESISDAENMILLGFHNFVGKVISEGTIRVTESGLAEIEASTTTGMSGSPILSANWPDSKVVGIYCGGPPLGGQRELIEILKRMQDNEIEAAIELIFKLPFSNREEYNRMIDFENLIKEAWKIKFLCATEPEKEFYVNNHPVIVAMVEEDLQSMSKEEILRNCYQEIPNRAYLCLYESVKCCKNYNLLTFNCGISVLAKVFQCIKMLKERLDKMWGTFPSVDEVKTYALESLINT